NANDAKNIRWHALERECDGQLCHPADSLQWKKVDELYPDFGNEAKNLRLGLATDGMNPYGNLSVDVLDGYSNENFKMRAMLRKAFNGDQENGIAPQALTGEEVFGRVQDVDVLFGKHKQQTTHTNIWKKRSVFFDLPYWCNLDVRHCIDVMHVEKNVCDSVIGTLLNIPGKTKDNANSRLDMVEMGIRQQLAPKSAESCLIERFEFGWPKVS
ncbi:hypothetical protein A2U01_0013305, partial [Trifolium medium]|nr:hypothetical protein [Trifolium medium]